MFKSIFSKVNMFKDSDSPFFGASVTEISVDDEAGGVFISIVQHQEDNSPEIRFDVKEINMLCINLKYMKKVAESLNATSDN